MKRSNKIRSFFIGMASAMAMSCVLHAAILTETQYFSGIPDFNSPMEFTYWNADWGVINAIYVEMGLYVFNGALRVDNDAGSGSSSTVEFGAEGQVTSPDVGMFTATFQRPVQEVLATTSGSLNLTADDGDAEVGGTGNYSNQGTDFGEILGAPAFTLGGGNVGAIFFNSFIGVGTYTVVAEVDQYANLGSFGGAQQQIDPLSSTGFVSITFDYTGDGPPTPGLGLVPEPASIALLLSSMAILLSARRRIRQFPRA